MCLLKAVSSGVGEESDRECACALGRSRFDNLQMRHDDPQIRAKNKRQWIKNPKRVNSNGISGFRRISTISYLDLYDPGTCV